MLNPMRIRVLSDLHTEIAPLELPHVDADVVVLAGDIGVRTRGLEWARRAFPSTPVVYVAGNHEYYGAALPHLTDKLRKLADGTNVSFLEHDEAVIGGVRFLGTTLWTDFGLFGRRWREGPTVVVTHHAPALSSVQDRFRADLLTAAYASDMSALFDGSAALWIHGHTHVRVDETCGGTRIVSNQRGYPDEPADGFDPAFTVDVAH